MLRPIPVQVSEIEITEEYVRNIRTYLCDPNRKPLDSMPGEAELHTNPIRLNHTILHKIFYFFMGFVDRRFWRGDRNDTFYYLRLLTIREQFPVTIGWKFACLMFSYYGLSGVIDERLYLFGSSLRMRSQIGGWIFFLGGLYGFYRLYKFKREDDLFMENNLIKRIRINGFWPVVSVINGSYSLDRKYTTFGKIFIAYLVISVLMYIWAMLK
jgi:hypothetical protein